MPDPLTQSIHCPILIGRDAQVAALARLLKHLHAARDPLTRASANLFLE